MLSYSAKTESTKLPYIFIAIYQTTMQQTKEFITWDNRLHQLGNNVID